MGKTARIQGEVGFPLLVLRDFVSQRASILNTNHLKEGCPFCSVFWKMVYRWHSTGHSMETSDVGTIFHNSLCQSPQSRYPVSSLASANTFYMGFISAAASYDTLVAILGGH